MASVPPCPPPVPLRVLLAMDRGPAGWQASAPRGGIVRAHEALRWHAAAVPPPPPRVGPGWRAAPPDHLLRHLMLIACPHLPRLRADYISQTASLPAPAVRVNTDHNHNTIPGVPLTEQTEEVIEFADVWQTGDGQQPTASVVVRGAWEGGTSTAMVPERHWGLAGSGLGWRTQPVAGWAKHGAPSRGLRRLGTPRRAGQPRASVASSRGASQGSREQIKKSGGFFFICCVG